MQDIDDAAILTRAQQFCDQNGTSWDKLTDYNRRRYLTRAREQLLDDEAGELISHGLFRDPQSGALAAFSLVAATPAPEPDDAGSRSPLDRDQLKPRWIEFSASI